MLTFALSARDYFCLLKLDVSCSSSLDCLCISKYQKKSFSCNLKGRKSSRGSFIALMSTSTRSALDVSIPSMYPEIMYCLYLERVVLKHFISGISTSLIHCMRLLSSISQLHSCLPNYCLVKRNIVEAKCILSKGRSSSYLSA